MEKESREQGLGCTTDRGPPGDASSPRARRPVTSRDDDDDDAMRCDAMRRRAQSHGSRAALPRRPELPAPGRDGEA